MTKLQQGRYECCSSAYLPERSSPTVAKIAIAAAPVSAISRLRSWRMPVELVQYQQRCLLPLITLEFNVRKGTSRAALQICRRNNDIWLDSPLVMSPPQTPLMRASGCSQAAHQGTGSPTQAVPLFYICPSYISYMA